MSVQQISSKSHKKFQSNLQSHTKNKLINSLINQKLTEEKQIVKHRYSNIMIKRSSQQKVQQEIPQAFTIRKRASSLKNLNISMSRIKSSLNFDPMKNSKIPQNLQFLSEQAKFIIERQYSSPLLSADKIQQLSSLRLNANTLQAKLNLLNQKEGSVFKTPIPGLVNYSSIKIDSKSNVSKNQQNKDITKNRNQSEGILSQQQFSQRVKSKLSQSKQQANNLWVPSLPHVNSIFQNVETIDENEYDDQKLFKKYLNIQRPNLQTLIHVKSSTFEEYGINDKNKILMPIKQNFNNKALENSQKQRNEQGNQINQSSKKIKLSISSTPRKSERDIAKLNSKDQVNANREQIVYDFKKYHKNDFKSLQKWFQENINLAHKNKHVLQKAPQGKTVIQIIKNLLNTLYSIHIGGFQQLIRLTYIQSYEKAILAEKIVWSFVRLIGVLIQAQHKINYKEHNLYQKQIKQQRLMYQERSIKLQKMMFIAQDSAKKNQLKNKRISQACVTYKIMNKHLYQQLQLVRKQKQTYKTSYEYTNLKLMNLIGYIQMQDFGNKKIKMIQNEQQTTYYYVLNKNQRLQHLVTIPTSLEKRNNLKRKKIEKQIEENMAKESKEKVRLNPYAVFNTLNQQLKKKQLEQKVQEKLLYDNNKLTQRQFSSFEFQKRVGQKIGMVQHELNKYWINKQKQLKINQFVQQELQAYNTSEIGVSTLQKFETANVSTQFPDSCQESFQQFLKIQLNKQRQKFNKQKQEQNTLYVSLKQLYEQSYQKIKKLEKQRQDNKAQLTKKNEFIRRQQLIIQKMQNQLSAFKALVDDKMKMIKTLEGEKQFLNKRYLQMQAQLQVVNKKLSQQHQNSQNLVRSALHAKQKLQKFQLKYRSLEQKNNLLTQTNQQLNEKIEQNKKLYQQLQKKHQKLHQNMISLTPAMQNFLDYTRFDKDSIIISKVKEHILKYLGDYFCKDSEVFSLTKG